MELDELKGGINLIKKDKPILSIEICKSSTTKHKKNVKEFLSLINYTLKEQILANYIFIPNSKI